MERELWRDLLIPAGDNDQVYELFHENSKIGRHMQALSDQEVRARMAEFHESLVFEGYPIIPLPSSLTPLHIAFEHVLTSRVSVRSLTPCPLSLRSVTTLLSYAYGITRDKKDSSFPRSFRVVPSGGALYPLEIFFHSAHIDGQKPGLYHYNPTRHHLRLLRDGDHTQGIAEAMVQPDIGLGASLLIFITAIFERSVFKYGDRGYRFVLIEAGHVAQNVNLVATALGLGSVNIGGFFDREIDEFLDLDGITHSTIYMIAIGAKVDQARTIED